MNTVDLEEFGTDCLDIIQEAPFAQCKAKVRAPQSSAPVSEEFLSLAPLSEEQLEKLTTNDLGYANWLRIIMLRMLVRTPVLGRLKQSSFNLTQVCDFLGFANFEKYVQTKTITEIRDALEAVLLNWESVGASEGGFHPQLQSNLEALAKIIGLNEVECKILGFGILIHAEAILDSCCSLLGRELTGFNIERILSPILSLKPDAVSTALQLDQKLNSSGVLSIDLCGRYELRQLMDLLTASFQSRMLMPQEDIRSLMNGFVSLQSRSDLTLSDYGHIQKNVDICTSLLSSVQKSRTQGVNILVYGKPGTGKSEFARVLAHSLGLDLLDIKTTNLAGAPAAPIRRVRSYRIAQSFFRDSAAVLLFDECEEVLNQVPGHDRSDNEATVPRKSWINKSLETNDVPTIWIANSLDGFDESYIRRFSVCFEMPVPNEKQRIKMLADSFSDAIGKQTQMLIAKNAHSTPAIVAQAASVISVIGAQKSQTERNDLVIHLINGKLQAQGQTQINMSGSNGVGGQGFDPAFLNGDADVIHIGRSLQSSREGRICLYGPPGTGKTAFGKWISQEMGVSHLVFKASDLMSAYVGETERNIANAFHQAKQQKAVLQLDEVDSFLQDRSKADRNWAVTQVNEMLTQMESFNGVFIASTNLFANLDEASLRRFDLAIKLDFMKPEAAWSMFSKTCEMLGLDEPDAPLRTKIWNYRSLTPGDFEQVIRRSKLIALESPQSVLSALESAIRLKKSAGAKPIGFLAVA